MNFFRPRPCPNQPSKEETPVLGGSDFPCMWTAQNPFSEAEQGILICLQRAIYFQPKEMQKHARNSALFAILNCFRLRKQMASNKKATSRICFHENNSLTFALIYFHPPPFPALPSRGRVGNSLPSRPPTSLTLPRPDARPHALPRARSRSALTKAGTL